LIVSSTVALARRCRVYNKWSVPCNPFKEDQSRAREGHAAQNLATLRRLALNAIKREKSKHSMRLKVKKAGWNNDFLLALLGIDPA
jgi:hypothetical protein